MQNHPRACGPLPRLSVDVKKASFRHQPGDKMPLSEPMLAWSFNRDGEPSPGSVETRGKGMHIDLARPRKQREDLRAIGKPRSGVDDDKRKSGKSTQDIPGWSIKRRPRGELM